MSATTHRPFGIAVCATLVSLVIACASLGSSNGGDASTYQARVGPATYNDIRLAVPRILDNHGFAIRDARETSRSFRFETEWTPRSAFDDEAARGYTGISTRLLLTAEMRGDLYMLRVTAQSRAPAGEGGSWQRLPVTEEFRDYAETIVRDLELRLESGVRVY